MKKTRLICGIVGFPLKNPRSIPIWKSFFKKKKIFSEMNKFEIKPNKLKSFVNFIKKK